MKNNKGITLMSLVVYIAIILIVTATTMRITTYFRNNMEDVADVNFEKEFSKMNLYLLDESKKIGNQILEIKDGNEITFSSGNKYFYNKEEKTIYLNGNIKLCENVDNCIFEQKIAENGKSIIELKIEIRGTIKTVEYVIKHQKSEQIINELDYTWNVIEENSTT